MKSMTGFGRGTAADASLQVTVEISAVNSRKQIEMRVCVPRELVQFEPEIRVAVQKRLSRGTLNIAISYQHTDANGVVSGLPVDFELAANACQKLRQFTIANGLPSPTLQDLLLIPGVLKSESADLEALKPLIFQALESALDALDITRSREGEALQRDLTMRGNTMLALLHHIEDLEKGAALAMKERLLERIRALKIDIATDDERLAKEVAFLVDKTDITEEMVRLKSHLDQYMRLMTETTDVGRNLDFLCQEMNREANTLGSKCSEDLINDEALALKVELSKVREQIMNVE